MKLGKNGPHQWITDHFLGGFTCQCFFYWGPPSIFIIFFWLFLHILAADGSADDLEWMGGLGGLLEPMWALKVLSKPSQTRWSQLSTSEGILRPLVWEKGTKQTMQVGKRLQQTSRVNSKVAYKLCTTFELMRSRIQLLLFFNNFF